MQVVSSPQLISEILVLAQKNGNSIGLVPTMGALHEGHLSLIRKSKEQNSITVVSIFVNRFQFNDLEDFNNYPRPFEQDQELLSKEGVDIVFSPSEDEMYPETPLVGVNFGIMAETMEGKFRSGHFEGVGLVVTKLLNHIRPDKTYFGMKDLQQFLLVSRLVKDFSFSTEIVGLPIKREENGLAMSSRNERLSSHGKDLASGIFRGLKLALGKISNGSSIRETKLEVLAFYKETKELEVEYLEFVNTNDLSAYPEDSVPKKLAICVAIYVEGIRLIDNIYLRQD
ncbi:MAG: pantoate--beta-alanine ligase [Cyclobacteriaceae bacterium]